MGRRRVDPRECNHTTALVEGREGARRARCLVCATVGPERDTSEEAVAALRGRGERDEEQGRSSGE